MTFGVAPRVGAWIETQLYRPVHAMSRRSHPVWVRGLKRYLQGVYRYGREESHPVWVRGLKQAEIMYSAPPQYVAPRVGAWIETRISF